MRYTRFFFWILVLALFCNACQPLLEAPLQAQVPGLVHTLAVQTMAADQSLRALLNTATPVPAQLSPSPTQPLPNQPATSTPFPSLTPLPTLTPLPIQNSSTDSNLLVTQEVTPIVMQGDPSATNKQSRYELIIRDDAVVNRMPEDANPVDENGQLCNQMLFVQDVTIPDETTVNPGEEFTKIWQVKNIGTCTWTPDYYLIPVWGNDMGTNPPVPLGKFVKPGEITEISMEMKAPYMPACYITYWMMTDENGYRFGTGNLANGNIWVCVSVTVPYLDKHVRFG